MITCRVDSVIPKIEEKHRDRMSSNITKAAGKLNDKVTSPRVSVTHKDNVSKGELKSD